MSEPGLWKKISVEGFIDNKTHIELMDKMIQYMAEQGMKPVEMTKL